MQISSAIIKQQEKRIKNDLRTIIRGRLDKICVNKPKITNLVVHEFKVLNIDDLGRAHCTYKHATFTFTDTYMFLGKLETITKSAKYDGSITIIDEDETGTNDPFLKFAGGYLANIPNGAK